MSINGVNPEDFIRDVFSQIEFAKSLYLSMLSNMATDDCFDEFAENISKDFQFVKKVNNNPLCKGIVKQRVDAFESFLLTLPSQFNAMDEMRIRHEKTE